jgi:tetratricopeptide (TPR) repeat protein
MNIQTLTAGIAATLETPDFQAEIREIEASLPGASDAERALLCYRLGSAALVVGDVRPKALAAFAQAHDLAVQLGDRRLEAAVLNGLSVAHDAIGRRHEALREAEEAERLATAIGDRRLVALALNNQGQFYKENGENAKAFHLFKEVQDIGYALGDDRLVMAGYVGLGRTTPMADADLAMGYYEQALVMAGALGDVEAVCICLNNLSDWLINTGRYADAIALRDEAERLNRAIGSREGIGRSLIGKAKAYTLLDDLDQAWAYLKTGLPVVIRAGDIEGELHSYLNLAYLYVQQGDIPRACEYYQQTLEKSLAAPDHACALFAQRALDQLAAGEMPRPAILPPEPVTAAAIRTNPALAYTYPTGDRKIEGGRWIYNN